MIVRNNMFKKIIRYYTDMELYDPWTDEARIQAMVISATIMTPIFIVVLFFKLWAS